MAQAFPLETSELQQIASNACQTAIGEAEKYEHANVESWNTEIINSILRTLIERTTPVKQEDSSAPAPSSYKYICNSTIIQHLVSADPSASTGGRRGMHSATGAYWNNERDGTWSYKWEGAEAKGMDIIITVTWIAL